MSPPGSDFAVADFDEDGVLDAAVPGDHRQFHVRPGDGTGAFGPGVEITGPGSMCNMAALDVDQDGHADLVTSSGSYQGWILDGDGDGGFPRTQAVPTANPAVPQRCGHAIGAQLDGGGKLDLAFISDEQDRIAVLLNTQ